MVSAAEGSGRRTPGPPFTWGDAVLLAIGAGTWLYAASLAADLTERGLLLAVAAGAATLVLSVVWSLRAWPLTGKRRRTDVSSSALGWRLPAGLALLALAYGLAAVNATLAAMVFGAFGSLVVGPVSTFGLHRLFSRPRSAGR